MNIKIFAKKRISEKSKARLFLALPFVLLDIFIRILTFNVQYIMPSMIIPSLLFSAVWIFSIVSVCNIIGKIAGRIFYGFAFLLFFTITYIQTSFYLKTGNFFSLSVNAVEFIPMPNPVLIATGIFLIGLIIFILMNFPKFYYKVSIRKALSVLLIFILSQLLIPLLFGFANTTVAWDNWRNPRNVYQNFNDYNKSIKVCGLYQYTFRDFYKSVLFDTSEPNLKEIEFLDDIHTTPKLHQKNDYTGIFEGKNVIFLQMEGIDSWLLNPEDMPYTYALLDNSLNFINHYSYNIENGATFNSEFAVTTGYISPVSFEKSAYEFFTNSFPYSLPRMLKDCGYTANAFHMNSGEYYCRGLNYKNFGYDNYYSLMDDEKISGANAKLDRELILNKSFYKKMFCGKKPFMNYIITYTPHKPFTSSSDVGKALLNGFKTDYSEEAIARIFASETDYMLGVLIQALKDNDLYENTVIVAFSDHYLYTLEDQSILEKYKNTENQLINNTPFFIWSCDLNPLEITKVNSHIDILPTILNMFGISYNENNYIGNDIFDEKYNGYAFFNDYDWYDGSIYYENGNTSGKANYTLGDDASYEGYMNYIVHQKIMQNDYTLKNDYFKSALCQQLE